MLEHLFGSKTRVKLLRIFFRDETKSYYVRELTRLLEAQINAVRRELELLKKIGLIKEVVVDSSSTETSQKKYFKVNSESSLYPELNALLLKAKLVEQELFIGQLQEKAGTIDLMLLTGRFTGDRRAPSDILLVGDIKERAVSKIITGYEHEFGFEIRYTVFSSKEFAERRHIMDKFLYELFEAKHIKIVDKLAL